MADDLAAALDDTIAGNLVGSVTWNGADYPCAIDDMSASNPPDVGGFVDGFDLTILCQFIDFGPTVDDIPLEGDPVSVNGRALQVQRRHIDPALVGFSLDLIAKR